MLLRYDPSEKEEDSLGIKKVELLNLESEAGSVSTGAAALLDGPTIQFLLSK